MILLLVNIDVAFHNLAQQYLYRGRVLDQEPYETTLVTGTIVKQINEGIAHVSLSLPLVQQLTQYLLPVILQSI